MTSSWTGNWFTSMGLNREVSSQPTPTKKKVVYPPKVPASDSSSQFTGRSAAAAALSHRANEIIPGGAHTYAKGDDQYPERSPAFIARGLGCRIWDTDGNQ